MILAGLLLASSLERPELLAVRCEQIAGGAAVKVLATAPIDGVTTEKSGDGFVLLLPATLPEGGLSLPEPVAPLGSLAFEASSTLTRLRVGVSPGAAMDVRSDGSLLVFSFRSIGTDAAAAASGDVEQLYPLLFPSASERTNRPEAPPASESEETRGRGLRIGSVDVKPSLAIRYIDAESTFLDTPVPVAVTYLEVQPQLELGSDVAGGRLSVIYGPRFRNGEDGIPVLRHPSHFLSVDFSRPLASSLHLSISDQYARGAIETQVVDPGREYFYDLGAFERNQIGFVLRKETAGRLGMSVSGSTAHENVDPGTGYVSNDRYGAGAALSYALSPLLQASLSYQFDRIPPPAHRPIAESTGHSFGVALDGELASSWRAGVSAGYRVQDNPRAAQGGDHYEGLVLAANLRREFVNGAALTLAGTRSTQLSVFEDNAFYLANSLAAQLAWPLPLSFQLAGGVGYNVNDYRLNASQLDEPRRDRVLGWNVGLGRVLTSWSSLRVDYAKERRESNVPGLSTRTHSLVVQLTLAANGSR